MAMSECRAAAAGVLAALLVLLTPAVASAEMSWSTPTVVDRSAGTRTGSVACATSSQCTTIDDYGRAATFNPAAPGAPTPFAVDAVPLRAGGAAALVRPVACPATAQCTAVDSAG